MWKGKCVLLILQVIVTLVKAPGGGKQKSDYGYSREDQFDNPDYFWPISSSLHGNSAPTSSLTATLHQATLDTGEADLNSVNFDGTSQSFMTIPNNGALDGAIAFCWVFNLYPAKEQTATILEYGGLGETGNGVKLTQQGTFLVVTLYDETGTFVTDYQENVLTINSWNFVGFSYNNDWGHVDIIEGSSLTFIDISQKDLLVNAVGDVTIGNSPDGSAPFEGKISCLQFYPKALFNKALNNPPSYCSLAQWTDTSILDWTDTFVPPTTTTTTTPIPTTSPTTVSTTSTSTTTTTTTTTTTSTPTTIRTTFPTTVPTTTFPTTAPTSTTSITSTSTTTETSTMTPPKTTTATTTTPEISTTETTGTSPPSTSPRTATRGNQRFPQDICHSFNHMGSSRNIPMSDVISMRSQSTVTNCAQMCTSLVNCVTFSYSSDTKDCRLSDVTSPALEPSLDLSLRVYVLKTIDRNLYIRG